MLSAKSTRQAFLDYFQSKGHHIVPSSPLPIKNDPTLLFTNAGMNPFKDLFLGNAEITHPRIANTQKCLRVSGKHNDLEEVGIDTYHHTMFEMLGNWSFGDYFKAEAIEWAWEFLTEVLKLNKSKLYVTVFGGDQEEDLAFDQEAYDLWARFIDKERILSGSKKDNFWEMGETGPCGPCSEIHIDLRDEAEIAQKPGKELVNESHPQVVEIWNLVFMQFLRKADGSLESLPAKHVDTGMGFERLCMALQGKKSNYDTDVFQPIIKEACKISSVAYGQNEKTDIALRVIADHLRAVAFTIADGQLPSNTAAGYVIRRILRRAVRYAYSSLDFKEPLLYRLIPVLVREMGDFFPEIKQQQDFVGKVILEEENAFLRTLATGLQKLEAWIAENKGKTYPGDKAFELFDTFGFPIDLTELILRENGLTLDHKGFEAEMQKQKDRSRQSSASKTEDWVELGQLMQGSFVGYDQLQSESRVVRYRKVEQKGKSFYQIQLEETPFYPEGGGQVGDRGVLIFDGEEIPVFDTKKENGLILHYTPKLPQSIENKVVAKVDAAKREATQRNHSATHLLHEALREVLGNHVQQKGSLVSDEYLRFDFSHFSKVEEEQLARVEELVNERIFSNFKLQEYRSIPIAQAQEMGAMALFGEKYGDEVRAIKFGSSIELCGGCHVPATGSIGWFKITSESAVAAGIRRVEALTGNAARNYINDRLELYKGMMELLKNPKDPMNALQTLKEENTSLQKALEAVEAEKIQKLQGELVQDYQAVKDYQVLIKRLDLPAGRLKDLAFKLRESSEKSLTVLYGLNEGKVGVVVSLSDAASQNGLNANALIKKLAPIIKGGGGGQPHIATAGGSDATRLDLIENEIINSL